MPEIFKQVFCFLADGASRHLVYFDALQKDAGCAAGVGTAPEQMHSSHAARRFYAAFSWYPIRLFRRLPQRLFLWRLQIDKPRVAVLGLDTMVMDNDEARKRQGVEHTCKRVKGFQPLQLTCGGLIVGAGSLCHHGAATAPGCGRQDCAACRPGHPQGGRGRHGAVEVCRAGGPERCPVCPGLNARRS